MNQNPSEPAGATAPARAGLPRLGLILLAAVTLGWGVSWPAMKIVLNELSPWTFRAMTVPVAGLILLGLTRLSGLSLAVPRGKRLPLVFVALFNVAAWQVFSAFGVANLTSGRASLVAYTMPVWASIFSILLLGEALTAKLVVALVLGMGGIAVLMSGDLTAIGAAPVGVAYMLGAASTWALGIVLLKRIDWRMPTVSLAGWQLMVASVPIAALGWAVDGIHLGPVSTTAIGAVVFTVLIPIAFCNYAYFKVVSLFPANVSAIGTLMIPVIGVTTGGLMLGEPVGWREIAAMALIGGSLVLTLLVPARRSAAG